MKAEYTRRKQPCAGKTKEEICAAVKAEFAAKAAQAPPPQQPPQQVPGWTLRQDPASQQYYYTDGTQSRWAKEFFPSGEPQLLQPPQPPASPAAATPQTPPPRTWPQMLSPAGHTHTVGNLTHTLGGP